MDHAFGYEPPGINRQFELVLHIAVFGYGVVREEKQNEIRRVQCFGNFLLPQLAGQQIDLIHPGLEALRA